MKNQHADDPSAELPELQYKALKKRYIKDFLSALRHMDHPIFALLNNLPDYHFAIVRHYDYRTEYKETPDYYTVPEFYKNAASFHKHDEFCIMFGKHFLYFESELTLPGIERLYEEFMQERCEKGLRENKPIRLTRGLISEYRLTREDVRIVRAYLTDYNAAAQAKIQTEYDALKILNCVKK